MPTTTRWGNVAFGGSPLGYSSDDGVTHSLSARLGATTDAYVRRLSEQHYLAVTLIATTPVVSIGYGPAPIHALHVDLTADVTTSTSHLTFSHTMTVALTAITLTDLARLRHAHALAATLTADIDTFAWLGVAHLLGVTLEALTDAVAASLQVGHQFSASLFGDTITSATVIVDVVVPTPIEILDPVNPDTVTPATVNLIRNPVLEFTTEGWDTYGGASLEVDTNHAWFGVQSAAVLLSTFGGQGLAVQAAQGLALTPYGGSVLWSEVQLATEGTGVIASVWTRAGYTDDTTADGDAIVVAITEPGTTAEDWQLIEAPFLLLDDTKQLATTWVLIELAAADVLPATLFVGGAQIEYDENMFGPSEVIVIDTDVVAEAA